MKFSQNSRLLPVFVLLAVVLTSCAGVSREEKLRHESDFWQRIDTTSSLYLRGPKAQQRLHEDIARCTWEVREMSRLAFMREHIPAENKNGMIPMNPNSAEAITAKWDTPERKGDLLFEHSDYHDFETCMAFNGWERVEYLPYDMAGNARREYLDTIIDGRYNSRMGDYHNHPPRREIPTEKWLNYDLMNK